MAPRNEGRFLAHLSRWQFSRRPVRVAALLATAAVTAGVFAGTALAAYWDYSGNLPQHWSYYENGSYPPADWGVRLSRQYCGTKMEFHYTDANGGGFYIVPAPNGCATTDWTRYFDSRSWAGGMCYNVDGPTMWVNCRIDPNI